MLLRSALVLFRALFRTRSDLALEIFALRHQLMVLRRHVKRPQLHQTDLSSLGFAIEGVERLATEPRAREARHGGSLASEGL
jgi:hypothetical protein